MTNTTANTAKREALLATIANAKKTIANAERKLASLDALEQVQAGVVVELTKRDKTTAQGVVLGVTVNERGVAYAKVQVGEGMDMELYTSAVASLTVVYEDAAEEVVEAEEVEPVADEVEELPVL